MFTLFPLLTVIQRNPCNFLPKFRSTHAPTVSTYASHMHDITKKNKWPNTKKQKIFTNNHKECLPGMLYDALTSIRSESHACLHVCMLLRTSVCQTAVFYSLSRVSCTFPCCLAGFVGSGCFQFNNSVSWCVCVCVIQGECLYPWRISVWHFL